jgi:hypothetical protein
MSTLGEALLWLREHWLTSAALGVLVSLLGTWIQLLASRAKSPRQESLQERAKHLSSELGSAMSALAAISDELTREVESSQSLVARLQRDAKTYEELARVNREQAVSVAMLVRGELKSEGRRSFWMQFLVNFGFFAAGAVLTFLIR